MVALGLMLSTVGMDPLGGTVRFTFDIGGRPGRAELHRGHRRAFGVAEVLAAAASPSRVAAARVRFRELYPNREELRRSVAPMLRGSVLGFLVGLIPGPAATIASFVSYGVERRVSRYRDELGTGPSRASRDRKRPTTPRRAAAWCRCCRSACPSRRPRRCS